MFSAEVHTLKVHGHKAVWSVRDQQVPWWDYQVSSGRVVEVSCAQLGELWMDDSELPSVVSRGR